VIGQAWRSDRPLALLNLVSTAGSSYCWNLDRKTNHARSINAQDYSHTCSRAADPMQSALKNVRTYCATRTHAASKICEGGRAGGRAITKTKWGIRGGKGFCTQLTGRGRGGGLPSVTASDQQHAPTNAKFVHGTHRFPSAKLQAGASLNKMACTSTSAQNVGAISRGSSDFVASRRPD